MKLLRCLILPSAVINLLTAIATLIVTIVLNTSQGVFYPWLIAISIVFLINGIVFFFVENMSRRLEAVEERLGKQIDKAKTKKEPKPYIAKSTFSVGQTVMLVDFVTVDGKTFRKNSFGKIAKQISDDVYSVLFDEDRSRTYLISAEYLKGLSDL